MKKGKNQHANNLFFGLLDNELKHISEVKNGLECNCICPACDNKLVARNGGLKKIHHFAHYQNIECQYGAQTSLHIAAKKILSRVKRIKIPELNVFINTEIEKIDSGFISHGEFEKICDEDYVKFEKVELEKKLHKFIPDVILTFKGGKKLIIEIAVTHFVGRNKLDDIIKSKISAIEIDLSELDFGAKYDDLEEIIIHDISKKKWLHNEFGVKEIKKRKGDFIIKLRKQKEFEQRINELKRLENLKKCKEEYHVQLEESKIKDVTISKDKREEWYKKFYKEINYTRTESGFIIKLVKNCPIKINFENGEFYAKVYSNCLNCKHCRGERENRKYLICLHEHDSKKKY